MAAFSRWALIAVVVAAAVLTALGWISLRQWERSAELVVREQARDMAAMAAEKIEMLLRGAPNDAVARLRAAARDARPDAFEAALSDRAIRDVLEKTLGSLEAPTIVALLDPQNRTVYAREPIGAAQRLASARLREGLPDWQVALYQPPGLSPHRTVRRQVMLFTCALGILLVVILAGSVTTYRLMRRESEIGRAHV